MTNLVKGLAEVHHQDIGLVPLITVGAEVMIEFQQLCLTGELAAEPILEVVQDAVLIVHNVHNVLPHTMLEVLAADTGQTDGSVVLCKCLIPLLVYKNHVCLTQVIRHNTCSI